MGVLKSTTTTATTAGSCRSLVACLLVSMTIMATLLSVQLSPIRGDDKIKDLLRSSGIIEIKLVEAHVPDMDPLPGQGDSDVYARVLLNDTKELICETQIVQDNNKPKVSLTRTMASEGAGNLCRRR